uniref:ribonuclease H n=1 Tax=Latimeria chalumnae TaxID=7897 RepID=H2ZWN0_LATCH
GNFLASLDLKEAYLHMPIRSGPFKFLMFVVGSQHFQFQALTFGHISAHLIFSKVVCVLAATLRMKGVHVYSCVDDWLIKTLSFQEAQHSLPGTKELLSSHGLAFSFKKCILTPTQKLVHLGAFFDTSRATLSIPQGVKKSLL